MNLLKILGKIGKKLVSILADIKDHLGDDVIAKAEAFVIAAEEKFVDNAGRREWVVEQLKGTGLPESLARIAVEFALKLVKKAAKDAVGKGAAAIEAL